MKKIDKLIIGSFIGPFIITLLVVVFILLMKQMLIYFDDIIGKGLSWRELSTLMAYFCLTLMPSALPLAVLMSSLITFGNLGEHFELTAIKSLGISLTRALLPLSILVFLITVFAFFSNNYMVPKAALEAYSLLYDIKQKKPALDIRQGIFYSGIPDISIKVSKKFKDGKTLKDIIIYDHRGKSGNKQVIVADSGRMTTILGEQYLKLELFDGYEYSEGSDARQDESGRYLTEDSYRKTKFSKMQVVLDLSSFGMNRTDTKWFKGNRIMRNTSELTGDMDSVNNDMKSQQIILYTATQPSIFSLHFKNDSIILPAELKAFKKAKDSISKLQAPTTSINTNNGDTSAETSSTTLTPQGRAKHPDSLSIAVIKKKSDSLFANQTKQEEVDHALTKARMVKSQLQNFNSNKDGLKNEYNVFWIQWHKIWANSIACLAMFLIGAPLGSIIKKGGLGVPVIVSISFFIFYYILDIVGSKWAKQELVSVFLGVWIANIILFFVGAFFLRQARVDARLFDSDFYQVLADKIKNKITRFKNSPKLN